MRARRPHIARVVAEVSSLERRLLELLAEVMILPRRLSLTTPGVCATIPMVRGVWGTALHDLDAAAYEEVFQGSGPVHDRTPAYVMRPASPDPEDAPALEWMVIGAGIDHDRNLLRAWDVASGLGLGPRRHRFRIRAVRTIAPDGNLGSPDAPPRPWSLERAPWPLPGDPCRTPCRLRFGAPLRLRRDKRLVEEPAFADIFVAATRRLSRFLPPPLAASLERLRRELMDEVRSRLSSHWSGSRFDLQRYSASQRAALEIRGVSGELDLPQGPGPCWPLIAAARWLHIGKGTPLGLGDLEVLPLDQ